MTRRLIIRLGVVMLVVLVPTAGLATEATEPRAALESCLSAAGLELASGETPTISGAAGIGINPGEGPLMPGDLTAGVFVYGSEEEAQSAAAVVADVPFHDVVQEGAIVIVYADAPSPDERSAIEGCVAAASSGGEPVPSRPMPEPSAALAASLPATPSAAPTAAPMVAPASLSVVPDIGRGPIVVVASALEALCRQNAPDRRTRNSCLKIVREVLAPDGSIVVTSLGSAQSPSSATVAVADLLGLPEAEAIALLETQGLVPGRRTEAFGDVLPAGWVVAQSPGIGFEVPLGSAVDYEVSLGPEPEE